MDGPRIAFGVLFANVNPKKLAGQRVGTRVERWQCTKQRTKQRIILVHQSNDSWSKQTHKSSECNWFEHNRYKSLCERNDRYERAEVDGQTLDRMLNLNNGDDPSKWTCHVLLGAQKSHTHTHTHQSEHYSWQSFGYTRFWLRVQRQVWRLFDSLLNAKLKRQTNANESVCLIKAYLLNNLEDKKKSNKMKRSAGGRLKQKK